MSAPVCDRCGGRATRTVRCYLGCSHEQCESCAAQTVREREAEEAREDEASMFRDRP